MTHWRADIELLPPAHRGAIAAGVDALANEFKNFRLTIRQLIGQ
jgi:hypothetical protein